MGRNSRRASSSSEDSFGWVDMEGADPHQGKKSGGGEERTSEMEEDSSEDSDATEFEGDNSNEIAVNEVREQESRLGLNDPATVREVSGPLDTVSEAYDAAHKKVSENSASDSSSGEGSDENDRKDLKPFTKPLLVKKERFSHTFSDDSNIDSPLKDSLRIKAETRLSQQKMKESKCTPLIEGALVDSSQPLSFDIGANEDVWVVQCPYEITEQMLKGKTLNFSGVSSAEQFEGSVLMVDAEPEPINLLLPRIPAKLMGVKPSGHIIFKNKEREMTPQALHSPFNEDIVTSLPSGLKIRHPLFGVDISLIEELHPPVQEKKKKKKKKKNQDITDGGNEVHVTDNGADDPQIYRKLLDSSLGHAKTKKKKQMDEQPTDNICSQNLRKKNYNFLLLSSYSDTSPKISQKKHKKFKYESVEAVSQEISYFRPELKCITPPKKQKLKHLESFSECDKQVSAENSIGIEDMFSQKTKRKKYKNGESILCDKFAVSEGTSEQTERLAENSGALSLKKKKHFKDEKDFHSDYMKATIKQSSDEYSTVVDTQMPHKDTIESSFVKNSSINSTIVDPLMDELLYLNKKKNKKIKQNDTDFIVNYSAETVGDTKKKKRLSMERVEQPTSSATENISNDNLHYFDDERKKSHKKKRKKCEVVTHSSLTKSAEENANYGKYLNQPLTNTVVKEDTSCWDDTVVTEMHHKKKKKRKKSE